MGIYRLISGALHFHHLRSRMHHIFHANALDVCPYLCHQLIGAISFEHVSCRDSPSIRELTAASLFLDYFVNVTTCA